MNTRARGFGASPGAGLTALLATVLACALPTRALAEADGGPAPERAWTLRTRAIMSGSSTDSDPAGYKVYSGVAVEAGVARALGAHLALELTARTESREVDARRSGAPDTRLGSIELLPMTLMLDWSPLRGTWRPYVGAGVNLTICWEKSGALDDTQVSPSVGPAVGAGLDVAVSSALFVNLDVKWNLLRTDVSRAGARVARLNIDPLTFGVGVGVRL